MTEQLNQDEQNFDAAAKKKKFLDRFRIPFDENRRNAIKAGAVLGAGLVVGELAGCTNPEKNREQLVEELVNGKTEKVFIEEHQTLWNLHEKSGYTDIGNDTFVEAVHKLNPNYNFGKDGLTLQPKTELTIPVKEKE